MGALLMSDLPPLPPGFVLDTTPRAQPAAEMPPLPPGFVMQDAAASPLDRGSTLSDYGRMAMTAGVRGVGNLVDFLSDPLAPLRHLISPGLEAIEQSGKPHPGRAAGDLAFEATGVPEYEPTTPAGRVAMSAAQGAVGGGPFGIGGALLGAASGALGQGVFENTEGALSESNSERAATAAGLLPGALTAGGALGMGAIRSRASPRVETLMDAGVRPTPGQILGGSVGRLEESATSIPVLGDFIRTGRARAVEQFNRGAINDALAPIGERLDKATPLGREAIAEASDKISAAYQQAVPAAGAQLTSTAVQELMNLRQMVAQGLPDGHAKRFDSMLRQYVVDRVSPNGHMSGDAFKMAESDLGKEAAGYLRNRNSTFDDMKLGDALNEAKRILRESLATNAPAAAADVQAANQSFSRMLRVGDASARPGEEPGVFSPAQLQAAVKKFATPRQYQTGRGLLQDYADAGRAVLGNRVPDSGTPMRSLTALLGGYTLGGGPAVSTLAPALAGVVPAWAMYSPRGQAAIAQLLAGRPGPGLPMGLRGLLSSAPDELNRGLLQP